MSEAESDLCRQVRDFGDYLTTVLEVLEPSEAIRRGVTERYSALLKSCDRLEQWPSLVAGRGGTGADRRKCRVLAVNDDLHVIVLDAGSGDGVREGAVHTSLHTQVRRFDLEPF